MMLGIQSEERAQHRGEESYLLQWSLGAHFMKLMGDLVQDKESQFGSDRIQQREKLGLTLVIFKKMGEG